MWRIRITCPASNYASGAKEYHKNKDQDTFGYMDAKFFSKM
jgi:hypothetical protein